MIGKLSSWLKLHLHLSLLLQMIKIIRTKDYESYIRLCFDLLALTVLLLLFQKFVNKYKYISFKPLDAQSTTFIEAILTLFNIATQKLYNQNNLVFRGSWLLCSAVKQIKVLDTNSNACIIQENWFSRYDLRWDRVTTFCLRDFHIARGFLSVTTFAIHNEAIQSAHY